MEEKKMCSEGKELVLAQVLRGGGLKSGFYVVDLEAEKVGRTPVATLLNDIGDHCIVRLGSVIYNACGTATPDSDLFRQLVIDGDEFIRMGASCLELSKPHLLSLLNEGDSHCHDDDPLKSKSGSVSGSIMWKGVPAMCNARRFPFCASLGGKIYALGGSAPTSCIGEVFMPQCGEWNPLAPPPYDLPLERFCVSYPVIPDEKNERLLVHFRSAHALYAYYPANGKWDCLAHNFWRWLRATTLVDGVLYSHVKGTHDCLVAYDVMTKSWLKVVYSTHFPVKVCISKFRNMLHLGNDMLCLANSCPFFEEGNLQHTNLQFVKFRVKRTTPTEVHVTPGAISCFPFENYLSAINFIAL